jgi:hypothetical protein
MGRHSTVNNLLNDNGFFTFSRIHSAVIVLDRAAPAEQGAAVRAMIAPQTGAHLRAEPVKLGGARGDVPVQVRSHRSQALAALTLALGLYGCASSDVFDSNEHWFQKPFDIAGRSGGYTFSELQDTNSKRGPVSANRLVDASGACPAPAMPAANPVAAPAAAEGPGAAGAPADPLLGGGVELGMTECDVVYRAGAPSNVQIGTNPSGTRSAVLTYNGGPRPGIYRFEAGRLTDMDRVEVAEAKPAPRPKPKKAKLAKKKPAPAAPQKISTE